MSSTSSKQTNISFLYLTSSLVFHPIAIGSAFGSWRKIMNASPSPSFIVGYYFDSDSLKFVAEQNARVHIHNLFGSVDGAIFLSIFIF